DARRPTPDARRPTPDARRPTPDARRPTPDARRPTPDARRPTPDARRVVSGTGLICKAGLVLCDSALVDSRRHQPSNAAPAGQGHRVASVPGRGPADSALARPPGAAEPLGSPRFAVDRPVHAERME
ncbi:hypothetical protein, partial [Catellatospora paridis]|uniref:hypothetical protein n=1 Tax=Catellatospora paridis TaxID=1617086 RepID=UPI0038B37CAA